MRSMFIKKCLWWFGYIFYVTAIKKPCSKFSGYFWNYTLIFSLMQKEYALNIFFLSQHSEKNILELIA